MKLHQLLAVLDLTKKAAEEAKTTAYHLAQKGELFFGLSRTYTPNVDGDPVFPSEMKDISAKVEDLLKGLSNSLEEYYNLVGSQELTNQEAKADVVIDGHTVLTQVPVGYLLFLEKRQLQDLETFIQKLPILPADRQWTINPQTNQYQTEPRTTFKTKKETGFVVAYEATDKHPADVREVSKDIIEGEWKTVEYSSAISVVEKGKLLSKVRKLRQAVVKAREEANSVVVLPSTYGSQVLQYLFS